LASALQHLTDRARSRTSRTKVRIHGFQYVAGDFSGAFVDLREERGVVDDVPDAVADLFEADAFVAQGVAEKRVVLFEPERARTGDGLDLQVAVLPILQFELPLKSAGQT